MKIEDNFLNQEEFNKIQKLMMKDKSFPWYFVDHIVSKHDVDKFHFSHFFYIAGAAQSPFFNNICPILDVIKPVALWRIKANLLTRTPNIVENDFHVDMNDMPDEKIKQWTTAIFYVNTNNGYTKFENGTKVESVANRMLTFPTDLKHTAISCTDERTRIVINFNYFANA